MTGGWTLGTDSLGPMCKRVITSGRNRSETSQYHDEHDIGRRLRTDGVWKRHAGDISEVILLNDKMDTII
ncbi:hypothetical protein HZ326_5240 [Fusarium oxysporum f. sp. albedinis]|jgi:hypothetical protein|nr:hypothetical protein HZ326_5240 [Fusarium oxysporum f. sp. albedinis]KAK2485683.1 hypothetical protein H9L39_03663 [Fusarium oxysporum f. sp. albedinis]